MKKLFAIALMAFAMIAVSAPAQAGFVWSYTGTGVSASGLMTTAGPATSSEPVLSITGQRNGNAITGLVPLGTDAGFLYDNAFQLAFPQMSWYGVLFSVADFVHTNIYSDNGQMHEVYWSGGYGSPGSQVVDTVVNFTVQQVSEPGSLALLGIALLGIAVVTANKRNNSRRYIAPALA